MYGRRQDRGARGAFFCKVLNKHKKNPFFYYFAYQIFQFASDATVLKLKKGKKKEVVT